MRRDIHLGPGGYSPADTSRGGRGGGISSGHQWEYSADNLSGGYNKRTDTTGAIFSGPLRSAVSAVYSELIALIKCMR